MLVISQSGETADTLGALREARRRGHRALAICNVVGSTIARESDGGIYMHAGPEIGVASTKAFVSMLAILALLAVHLGRMRKLSVHRALEILRGLETIPQKIESLLRQEKAIKKLAQKYSKARDFFFSQPRLQFSDCPGRGAQAQGDFVHPRIVLSYIESCGTRKTVGVFRSINAIGPCFISAAE